MMSHMKLLQILAANIIILSTAYSQDEEVNPDDPTGEISKLVVTTVERQFGAEYGIAFVVLDSTIKYSRSTTEDVQLSDPFKTLQGCILFGADKDKNNDDDYPDDEHGIMGIIKNGKIIWHSYPIFKGTWAGIFTTKDINRDGKVDILVEWFPPGQIMVRYLWIISWDGTKGTIINQIDSNSGNSTLMSSVEMFEIVEKETTKPATIKGFWSEDDHFSGYFPRTKISTRPWVTYSWDGKKYKLDLKSNK